MEGCGEGARRIRMNRKCRTGRQEVMRGQYF